MLYAIVFFILVVAVIGSSVRSAFRIDREQQRPRYYVSVRQSQVNGQKMQHFVSAQIRDRKTNSALTFIRVDMREEGWDEKLAEATATMKQNLRTLEAAEKLAGELPSGVR